MADFYSVKMKIKKALGLTLASGWVVSNMTGCVYGPPPEDELWSEQTSQQETISDNEQNTETKWLSKNTNSCVYGPPPVISEVETSENANDISDLPQDNSEQK